MQSIYIVLPSQTIYERFNRIVSIIGDTTSVIAPSVPFANTVSTKPIQTVNTVSSVSVSSSTVGQNGTSQTITSIPPVQSQTTRTTVIQRDDRPVAAVEVNKPQIRDNVVKTPYQT